MDVVVVDVDIGGADLPRLPGRTIDGWQLPIGCGIFLPSCLPKWEVMEVVLERAYLPRHPWRRIGHQDGV